MANTQSMMPVMARETQLLLGRSQNLMPVEAMKAIIWAGFALCLLGFCLRVYIRYICFRRLVVEDFLMLGVLVLALGSAIVSQLRLHFVYIVDDVGNGVIPMPPTFLEDVPKAFTGVFSLMVLCTVGIYAVKLNFLLFFRRLGGQITEYTILWWIVTLATIVCFGATFGVFEYKCTLSDNNVIFFVCSSKTEIARSWRNMIISCTLDAFTDVLILCFPISILWRVRVTIRKKLLLTGVFCLTIFTIIVTIIRGTIQNGKSGLDFSKSQNVGWVWFWIVIEFMTAYIMACVVSFRMLFVHNEKKSSNGLQAPFEHGNDQSKPPRSPAKKGVWSSLLETFREWEGTSSSGGFLDGTLPSGRLSLDFMQDNGWAMKETSRPQSAKPLTQEASRMG